MGSGWVWGLIYSALTYGASKFHLLQSCYADCRLPRPIGGIGSEVKNPSLSDIDH